MRALFILMLQVSAYLYGQTTNNWQLKLDQYDKEMTPVKIGIIFHQPYYTAGDTAHFALHFLTARQIPIRTSQLITAHLVSASGKTVQTLSILCKNGWASNQFILPNNLEAGQYRVLVYCDWMKNFNQGLMCQETLLVSRGKIFNPMPPVAKLEARPEGGKLITGVSNRIFLRGKTNGLVSLAINDQVTNIISLDDYGYGTTTIIPQVGEMIKFFTNADTLHITQTEDGVSIFLLNPVVKNQSLRLGLQVNRNSSIDQAEVLIAHHNEVLHNSFVSFRKRNQLLIPISKQDFPTGISIIWVLHKGQVLSERLFFISSNQTKLQAELQLSETYTREKNQLRINIHHAGIPIDGRVTVSIFKSSLFGQESISSLKNQLHFRSELTVDPSNHLLRKEPLDQEVNSLDALLAMQSWLRFKPNEPPSKATLQYGFRQEQRIVGYVRNELSKEPIRNGWVSIYLSKSHQSAEIPTDNEGMFMGALPNYFYGTEETFFSVIKDDSRISPIQVEIINDSTKLPYEPLWPAQAKTDSYPAYRQTLESIQASYAEYSTPITKAEQLNSALEHLPKPDLSIDLDDYLKFGTMAETVQEIIPWLKYKSGKEKNSIRMYQTELAQLAPFSPMYIIDGVLTDDTEYFLQIPPREVNTIKLITKLEKLASFGSIGRYGVVLVETKIPNNDSKIPRTSAHYNWQGLSKQTSFIPILTKSNNIRVPQLTPVLLWAPMVSVLNGNAIIDFQASDDIGEYKVVIEGISANGEVLYSELDFKIIEGKR